MDVDKLLPGRKDLGDVHIVWHKLVPDLLELVISEGMVGRYREVPKALLVVDDYCLALVLKETGRINAVLVPADLVPELDRELRRIGPLVLFELFLVHILIATGGQTKLRYVYVVEDETDVVKDVGYLVVVIDKCDQILPVPKVIGEEDLLGVFLGGGYRLESCVENSGPVVVDEKETDLKVLGCLNSFHCCGILRLLLATYKRREGGNETGNLPEIRGELVAKDAVSRGDRYNYRDKGLGALGEPVKLDLVKIRAELVRNSHTVGLGSVAADLESKLEIAVLGLGDRDRTGSGNERETDAAELGVYFVGDRQSFVFIHCCCGFSG